MNLKLAFPSFALLFVTSTSIAQESPSCAALTAGNRLYAANEFDQALETFKTVERIDRIGKDVCTASVYATMGTIYRLKGNQVFAKDSASAAMNYREAAKYNRAFANAILCNKGDCKEANVFWSENF